METKNKSKKVKTTNNNLAKSNKARKEKLKNAFPTPEHTIGRTPKRKMI